ncbi:MAG: MBL fold metallo-hydrolase [Candidatus Aminicenantes bacterium]|nr:MBL fold metallo-hydrolase [Candidatus Aminicenantes bacterium]MDH5383559.1 MBL fold metallo-hydrolase [Candidatus Aminicenantes bacterium]MDH5744389.1 MBL fold metallo-hydrolase [Candidatus Aminicenantes bacterium]
MKKIISRIFCLALLFVFTSGISSPFERENDERIPGLGDPKITEIAKDVLAVTGLYHSAGKEFTVNAGIIFTPRTVIFIDSGMTIASGEFLWETARKRTSSNEDVYLILTHHHSDHVFGMRVMKEKGAKVIAHQIVGYWFKNLNGEKYKKLLAEREGWTLEKADNVFGDVILSEPDQLVEQDTVLHIDGEEIHVLVTPGHVPSELCVYHSKSKALFTGDAIYEGSALTTRFGGPTEWKLWISHLERLKNLEINTIVPGHGKLCSKEEIDRNIAFLRRELEKKSMKPITNCN